MTDAHPAITLATTAPHVRESLKRFCETLMFDVTQDAPIWLVDGHHTPDSLKFPKDAKVLVLGPIPKDLTPHQTLPTPITLAALRDSLRSLMPSITIPLRNGWAFDAQQRTLHHDDGSDINLTEKEAALLQALSAAYPAEISRDSLLQRIWAYEKEVDTHTVETHIYRLRSKCEAAASVPCEIVTQESGYRLVI
jgi:hypothetical protein